MYRALVGDVEQLCALAGVERSLERNNALDAIDLPLLRLTVGTVLRVDLLVCELDATGRSRRAARRLPLAPGNRIGGCEARDCITSKLN